MRGLALRVVLALGLVLLAVRQLGLVASPVPERLLSLVSVKAP
ncbi:hypothetical protein [Pseudoroseomonas ludipueritiae]|nr:hypothetical protein [Pseudoroseomonas ludipueritiae]